MSHKTIVALGFGSALAAATLLAPDTALAQQGGIEGNEPGGEGCNVIDALVDRSVFTELQAALEAAAPNQARTGGLGNNMWGAIVDQNGIVCAVANTGGTGPNDPSDPNDLNNQWLGSRAISAQKANTGVLFSLNQGAGGTVDAFSTANLFSVTQPGGIFFGLQFSNPVNPAVAYGDNVPGGDETSQGADTTEAPAYGTRQDPLVGEYIGGINVFGGGLTLYDENGNLVGGVGVSGDTSCADHNIAWIVRDTLGLDFVPSGVNPDTGDDNIIFDIDADGVSAGGFGHPACQADAAALNAAIVAACPTGDGTTAGCI